MNTTYTLEDKCFLLAGASGQIGRIIVTSILEAGGRVVAFDNDDEGLRNLIQENNSEVLACMNGDIGDRVSIDRALTYAHDLFGGLNGAVNTAYPRNAQYGRKFFEVEYSDFCENTNLHLGGYFLFMQACAHYALDRELSFSLVNLSSIYGSLAPRFDVYTDTEMTMPVEYAAIKAGLEHMTRYANAYMKGRGAAFRANCVSPGGILAKQDEKFLTRYRKHCLTKGMLDGQDIAEVILFLLSDASRYVVGQNLIVDDGFSI